MLLMLLCVDACRYNAFSPGPTTKSDFASTISYISIQNDPTFLHI